jgi:nucleoside-diphosphate-sugar epimerase
LSARAVTLGDFTIFNGEQWRPFVNTRDIGRAFVMVLEAPLDRVGGEIFNVGDNDQNFTLKELGETVARIAPGSKMNEVRNDEDLRNYRVRFDKIENAINFRASVTLDDGIREIIDAVKSGLVEDWTDPIYSNLKQMEGDSLKLLKADDQEVVEPGLETTRQFLRRAA